MFVRYNFSKLVRDKYIPDCASKDGFNFSCGAVEGEDLLTLLKEKLAEEANEVLETEDKEKVLKEIGDVYDVLNVLCRKYGFTKEEIMSARSEKNEQRGGFETGMFVDYVQCSEDNNSESHKYLIAESNDFKYEKTTFAKHIIDCCIVDAEKGAILMQKRSASRKLFPNQWELVGGALEKNETFESCLKRELKEETQLDLVENYGIIFEGSFEVENEKNAYTCYLVSAKGDVKLEEGKAIEFKWVSSLEEAAQLLEVTEETSENNVVFNAIANAFDIIYGDDEEDEIESEAEGEGVES
jgi:8-oxo-dGTP diphosphatase